MNGAKIYVDGGVGRSYQHIAWVNDTDNLARYIRYPRIGDENFFTNNALEYLAIIEALRAHTKGNIYMLSDSKLVVGQITMGWKINYPHLRKYRDTILELANGRHFKLNWVPREKNRAGQLLEYIQFTAKRGISLDLAKFGIEQDMNLRFINW